MEIKQLKQVEVVTDDVCDVQPINETGVWNFIGALGLWLQAWWWKMFHLCPGDIEKERVDEFMFDENFDPSTLEGLSLKWTYHHDRF